MFEIVAFVVFLIGHITSCSENKLVRTNEDILANRSTFVHHSDVSVSSTKSLALKVPSKIFHPPISLENISPNLFMKLVAGTSSSGYSGDNGPATSARISTGIPFVDASGNIYLPDDTSRIRKVDSAGIITTFGGTGTEGHSGTSGPINSASFHHPSCIIGDAAGTVLYFSDEWYVWNYLFSTNIVSVFAQSPNLGPGFSGDNGPASVAQLDSPRGLWLTTSGDLYVACLAYLKAARWGCEKVFR
jgi:hypothetical protein